MLLAVTMTLRLHPDLSSCSLPMDVNLENGEASCDWETCEIDCSEGKIIEAITHDVMENTRFYEWYLLSDVVILFLKSLQYCGVAVATVLLEAAAFILFRKYLRRDSMKFVYEQDMETLEIICAEGVSIEEAKPDAIRRHARWEKFVAVGYLVLAVISTAAWIGLRVYVATSVDFLKPKWFVAE